MTRLPCLLDSPSVKQTIDASGYRADLVLDPDATNALRIQDAALAVPAGIADSARVFRSAVQNLSSGDVVSFGAFATRWDNTGGRIGTSMTTSRSGLWLIGASLALNTGAANGGAIANITAPVYGVLANDSGTSVTTMTTTPSTPSSISLNPTAIVFLGGPGISLSLQVFHTFGGTIPTLASAQPPTVNTGEFYGAEMWMVCLEGLVL